MTYLARNRVNRDLTGNSYCSNGLPEMPGGFKIGGGQANLVYEITILEEYTKVNNLRGDYYSRRCGYGQGSRPQPGRHCG
jgi:hypothetical protein